MRYLVILLVASLTACAVGPLMGERYTDKHPDLPPKVERHIEAGTVYVGMPAEYIVPALGKATSINARTNERGTVEQWVFANLQGIPTAYVYVQGGEIVEIQDMGRGIR